MVHGHLPVENITAPAQWPSGGDWEVSCLQSLPDAHTSPASSVPPAGSWRPSKQVDPGLAAGPGLHRPVRHLPLLLRPHRVQRLHLRQPPHVSRHPLTALLRAPPLLLFLPLAERRKPHQAAGSSVPWDQVLPCFFFPSRK